MRGRNCVRVMHSFNRKLTRRNNTIGELKDKVEKLGEENADLEEENADLRKQWQEVNNKVS